MTHTQSPIVSETPVSGSGLERLDAYRVAIEFYRCCARPRADDAATWSSSFGEPPNRWFSISPKRIQLSARTAPDGFASQATKAAECHAALDLMEIRGELAAAVLAKLRALLDRERAMLWRLGRR